MEKPGWFIKLDPREQAQIEHARHYREHFSHAGAPGHGQFLLIAKLSDLADKSNVTAAVASDSSISDAISAIEDIAELCGWPCIDSDRADDNFVMTFKRGGL